MSSIQFFLLAGGRGERLRPLTDNCCKPMVRFGPFGRIIDFSLYNVLAAEGGDLFVLTQYCYGMIELYLHVQWRSALSSRGRKFMVLPGKDSPKREYLGTADAVYQALITSRKMPKYLVVLSADHIGRLDFKPLIDFHKSHGGAATVAVTECSPADGPRQKRIAEAREDGGVSRIYSAAQCLPSGSQSRSINYESMDVYVFTTSKLIRLLELNQREESHDLDADVLPQMAGAGDVRAYPVSSPEGSAVYWRDLNDLYTYWLTHLELLSGRMKDLYFDPVPGLMRPPVSRFNLVHEYETGATSIYHSMVWSVENIGAARVADSVIGPGSYVESGAEVSQSVVMEGAVVRKGARIKAALVEPHVDIKPGYGTARGAHSDRSQQSILPGLHQMIPPADFMAPKAVVRPSKEA
jgi:glucose-1-phosphate adenylyltransferase